MPDNKLHYGDNLDILRRHMPDNAVDLIYLDPPFNSSRNYDSPMWGIYPRIQIMTVSDLLNGAEVKMPRAYGTFKQAERIKPDIETGQMEMFDE